MNSTDYVADYCAIVSLFYTARSAFEKTCARVPHGPTSPIFPACLRDLIAITNIYKQPRLPTSTTSSPLLIISLSTHSVFITAILLLKTQNYHVLAISKTPPPAFYSSKTQNHQG
ncbi:hypothetical protein NC651_002731 [Populus alba x Populus x berolinensis]|nr:hypothetical protein NC651_002731 [Populus alba x Populus x berolinensis]